MLIALIIMESVPMLGMTLVMIMSMPIIVGSMPISLAIMFIVMESMLG
jgi:hypothetical protein